MNPINQTEDFGQVPPKNIDQFVESFTFTCDGEKYEVSVNGNTFSVHLENRKTYDVELVFKGIAGLTTEKRTNVLLLNSEDDSYEMIW